VIRRPEGGDRGVQVQEFSDTRLPSGAASGRLGLVHFLLPDHGRHRIVFRSHEGSDDAWNLTTLCAWYHQRGAHGRGLKVWGRAPDNLLFELGVGRFGSGDRKVPD